MNDRVDDMRKEDGGESVMVDEWGRVERIARSGGWVRWEDRGRIVPVHTWTKTEPQKRLRSLIERFSGWDGSAGDR